jgi:light-harvesting protein B-800-850 alpha chain
MNQGKIWLVVKPTVGLPLFLGGVAVIALCVHAAILTNTDWYPAYYNGNQKAKKAEMAAPATVAAAAPAAAAAAAPAPEKKGK